jgi:O-antigen/teichoic acid export membrane protein
MNALTQAMGPEITTLYGRKDWPMLFRLYNYSERLIFSLIPIFNFGVLFLSPFLLTVWIHGARGRGMFLPYAYMFCAGISIIMSVKEHKLQFQSSTNTHKQLASFMFISYIILGCIWLMTIPRFGIYGLLWGWMFVEMCQLFFIVRLNMRLFVLHERIELKFLLRLLAFSAALMAISIRALPFTSNLPLMLQIVASIALCGVIFLIDFPLFDLAPVLRKFRERLKQRANRGSSAPAIQL